MLRFLFSLCFFNVLLSKLFFGCVFLFFALLFWGSFVHVLFIFSCSVELFVFLMSCWVKYVVLLVFDAPFNYLVFVRCCVHFFF